MLLDDKAGYTEVKISDYNFAVILLYSSHKTMCAEIPVIAVDVLGYALIETPFSNFI